jgi:hypothetical protein
MFTKKKKVLEFSLKQHYLQEPQKIKETPVATDK